MGMMVTIAVCCLSACSDHGVGPSSGYYPAAPVGDAMAVNEAAPKARRESKPAEERPGLATGFGKRVKDEWHQQSFVRDGSKPKGTDVIYYNDREGVKAMTGYKYKVGALQTAAGDMVEWRIPCEPAPRQCPQCRGDRTGGLR